MKIVISGSNTSLIFLTFITSRLSTGVSLKKVTKMLLCIIFEKESENEIKSQMNAFLGLPGD